MSSWDQLQNTIDGMDKESMRDQLVSAYLALGEISSQAKSLNGDAKAAMQLINRVAKGGSKDPTIMDHSTDCLEETKDTLNHILERAKHYIQSFTDEHPDDDITTPAGEAKSLWLDLQSELSGWSKLIDDYLAPDEDIQQVTSEQSPSEGFEPVKPRIVDDVFMVRPNVDTGDLHEKLSERLQQLAALSQPPETLGAQLQGKQLNRYLWGLQRMAEQAKSVSDELYQRHMNR